MKKIILAAIVCLIGVTFANAQGSKGNLFMGAFLGTTTYSSGTNNINYPDGNYLNTTLKNYSFDIGPTIGVYLTDHLVFGGNLTARFDHGTVDQTSTEPGLGNFSNTKNTSLYSIGPFVRYYFFNSKPSSTLFFIQGDGSVGTGGGSSNITHLRPTGDITGSGNISGDFAYTAGASLGITHYVQKNIGLDISLGYEYDHETYSDDLNSGGTANSRKYTNKSDNLAIRAGFHVILP